MMWSGNRAQYLIDLPLVQADLNLLVLCAARVNDREPAVNRTNRAFFVAVSGIRHGKAFIR